MAVFARTVMAVAVMVVPGAFFLFLAYVGARVLRARWQAVRKNAPGRPVAVREVFRDLHFRDVLREARAAI